jgi:hypothetical protein
MNRTLGQVKVKRQADREQESSAPLPDGDKMSPSEMLRLFDELWRIERAEDLQKLRAKEQKAKALREAIASLDN